jgi:hypothetical protein
LQQTCEKKAEDDISADNDNFPHKENTSGSMTKGIGGIRTGIKE